MARPLKVDQTARGIMSLALVASSRQDPQLALEVCEQIAQVSDDYELRLKSLTFTSTFIPVENFRGVPARTSQEYTCAKCGFPIPRNFRILFDQRQRAAAHLQCPTEESV